MSNPTREEVEKSLKVGMEGCHSFACECYQCRLEKSYLHALNMVDEVKQGLNGPIESADTVEEALIVISDAVKKFEGNSSKPVPEERCSHGIPRKECGSDD